MALIIEMYATDYIGLEMKATYQVLVGDCVESMQQLPDGIINCCVTSPPYFGLRDYGVDGQIGLEQTPEEYVTKMVEVFREVRRLLRDDGTLWLNIGDSYAGSGKGAWDKREGQKERYVPKQDGGKIPNKIPEGLKRKDLIGIPWRLALALQSDGWWLRSDVIWNRPNAKPENVRDRPCRSHEYIFMLTKNEKYFFDYEASKQPTVDGDGLRNMRTVWDVNAKPYKGAHFATFPPALIEPCILAGCPQGGIVLDPFGGSGTTAGVSVANGRNAILCELNPEYAELVDARVSSIVG